MDIPEIPEQTCSDCGEKSYREHVLKSMTPEGIANCLTRELKSCTDEIDFHTKKADGIKAILAKLQQP